MYKVVLVDDEKIVLEGIQKVYHLEEYGFQVVGAFADAAEALEHLADLAPELIITDMKMPKMTGLEFIDSAKKIMPNAEYVVLSGHDDFVFAQESLKLGVADYLLKPVKKEAFTEMLTKLHEKIHAKLADQDYYSRVESWLNDNVGDLTSKFFVDLSENDVFDDALYQLLEKQHNESIMNMQFILVRIDIGSFSGEVDYISSVEKLGETVLSILSEYGKVYRFQTDDTISFYVHSSQDDNRQITKEGRAQIESEMKAVIQKETEQGNILTVGVSRIHDGLMELFQARNECVRYIFMTNAELDIQEDEHELGRVEVDAKLPYLEIEHLFQEISAGNTEGIAEEVRKAYEPAKAYIAADVKDYASLITFLILLRIYQMQAKVDPELEIIRHNQLDIRRIERDYPTLESQMRLAMVTAEQLAGAVAKQGVGSGKKIIQEALDYIEQHFCENISLADVADAISISKNYLANLFKKELDITLINYVTNLRIEEAKRLLRQGNLKMYEVAGAVGYNDYAYFSQLFKKHTGVTLSAYKSSAI